MHALVLAAAFNMTQCVLEAGTTCNRAACQVEYPKEACDGLGMIRENGRINVDCEKIALTLCTEKADRQVHFGSTARLQRDLDRVLDKIFGLLREP